jgi:hypothetical protein
LRNLWLKTVWSGVSGQETDPYNKYIIRSNNHERQNYFHKSSIKFTIAATRVIASQYLENRKDGLVTGVNGRYGAADYFS